MKPIVEGRFNRLFNGSGDNHFMRAAVKAFLRDELGATAIEYALIAAGISITIVVAVTTIGTTINATFSSVSSQLK